MWYHKLRDLFKDGQLTLSPKDIEIIFGVNFHLKMIYPRKQGHLPWHCLSEMTTTWTSYYHKRLRNKPVYICLDPKLDGYYHGRMAEITNDTTEASMLILTYGTEVQTETSMFTDKSLPLKPNVEEFWRLESI